MSSYMYMYMDVQQGNRRGQPRGTYSTIHAQRTKKRFKMLGQIVNSTTILIGHYSRGIRRFARPFGCIARKLANDQLLFYALHAYILRSKMVNSLICTLNICITDNRHYEACFKAFCKGFSDYFELRVPFPSKKGLASTPSPLKVK